MSESPEMVESGMEEISPVVVDSDIVLESPRKRRGRLADRPDRDRESKPMAELREKDDRGVAAWMRGLSPSGAVRVRVTRTTPTMWQGFNVGGIVGTYEEMIDDAWILERHGGGTYELEVKVPAPQGGWKYGASRTLKIAGDPRTDDVYRSPAPAPAPIQPVVQGPSNGLVESVMKFTERQLERNQQQAGGHGADLEAMRLLMAPMQQQIDQFADMLREKDRQLTIAQQTKPEQDPFRDKMLDKFIDADTARITALRAQYESELRQVKQSAIDNEARLRDGFDRDKQTIAMAHDRELKSLGSAHAMTVAAQEQSAATSRMLLDAEIGRLTRDNAETKAELVALRARKDKTQIEVFQDAVAMKNIVEEFGGGGKSEEKTGWDKFGEFVGVVAGNNPAVQGLVSKVVGGEVPAPAPPPLPVRVQPRTRRMPAPPRHYAGPDGNLYRARPDGAMEIEATRPPGQPAIPQIPATTIKVAVDFLEAACRNGQDPNEVATSVRSMIPADVLTAIRELGIDGFLSGVAKIDGASPLASQAGRNWTRKLGKALVGE